MMGTIIKYILKHWRAQNIIDLMIADHIDYYNESALKEFKRLNELNRELSDRVLRLERSNESFDGILKATVDHLGIEFKTELVPDPRFIHPTVKKVVAYKPEKYEAKS